MITINLLPSEYRALARQRQMVILSIISAGVIASVMILFLLGRITKAARLQSQIRGLDGELSRLETVVTQIKQMDAARALIQSKVDVIQKLDQKRLTYPILFDDFLTLLPSGVWIVSLQTTPDKNGSGYSLVITAKATSLAPISTWLSNLETSHYFHSPQINSITSDATSQSATFTLTCEYEHPAAVHG
jgi:Tfp pilus assembly protein PilN